MDKKFGYYVFGGMLLGTILGWIWAASEHTILGIGIGNLASAFIGRFAAAAAMHKEKENKETTK